MNDDPSHRSSLIGHRSRLLVLRLSALGDVIHTIPAVVGLKEQFDITWVVEAPYRELVELVAGVKTIPVRLKKEPMSALHAVKAMRGFDTSIDFQGLIKSAALPWAAGVKERIGFDKNAIREKPALWFTNRKVEVDTTRHVIDQNLELAHNAGQASACPSGGAGGQAEACPTWTAFVEPIEAKGEIVLLPGAGKPDKIWPYFGELAQR
ncbi:MAG TPA: glycosyltransferase family 9 protein, partial [Thermoanaerobaculia bacterium]